MAIPYSIISFVVMIATMVFTKSSPLVLFDIFGSAIASVFPFFDYVQMTIGADDYQAALCFLVILSEWLTRFFHLFLDDEEDMWLFTWLGDFFIVLSVSMLSTTLLYEQINHLVGFLMFLFCVYVLVIILFGFINYGMSAEMIGFMLKMIFINPIFLGFITSLLRMGLPAIIMLVVVIPLTLIPVYVIQCIGVIITVLLGYFCKQFSDKLIDNIDCNETAISIRFAVAIIIVVAEILIQMGIVLPQFSA